MKIKEIRNKKKSELMKLLGDNREKLRSLRFDLVSGKVKNIREIRMIKKNIARIMTIISESSNVKAQMPNQAQNQKSK